MKFGYLNYKTNNIIVSSSSEGVQFSTRYQGGIVEKIQILRWFFFIKTLSFSDFSPEFLRL